MIRDFLTRLYRTCFETTASREIRERHECDHDWEPHREYQYADYSVPSEDDESLIVSVRKYEAMRCSKCDMTWSNRCIGTKSFRVDAQLINDAEYDTPVTYHASAK